ncbi:hypothetical protein BBBOND_0312890 [Babesia bigemina]|uniref:Uncharacterized protein n=1 Tax=Babesia bigemina TaxID=5866 RepID=A0A061D9M8_BABBI|nr:hypothetical protein BBBOND_0312890 [Babesia bigemina]CDR97386.1 hypothetical protein BBBOND_0312890 [Babesia bigemina]|eukprot:XP_012769572.1 hypothetical protein BBBOND_0312890 [Babesia bigemina]
MKYSGKQQCNAARDRKDSRELNGGNNDGGNMEVMTLPYTCCYFADVGNNSAAKLSLDAAVVLVGTTLNCTGLRLKDPRSARSVGTKAVKIDRHCNVETGLLNKSRITLRTTRRFEQTLRPICDT